MNTGANRILDELAKLMTDAAGTAQGVKKEAETIFRSQAERVLNKFDLVTREEFEVVKEMAAKSRIEADDLKNRLASLEEQFSAQKK